MKEPGQIVLFRFPRADLSDGKLRPALLLSEVPGPYSTGRAREGCKDPAF